MNIKELSWFTIVMLLVSEITMILNFIIIMCSIGTSNSDSRRGPNRPQTVDAVNFNIYEMAGQSGTGETADVYETIQVCINFMYTIIVYT